MTSTPWRSPRTMMFAAALAGLVASLHAQASCEDISASEGTAGDLRCVARWIETEQSWPEGARRQAEAQLAALAEEASALSEVQLYAQVARITGLADNGHSGVTSGPIYQRFGLLPIRTYWFDDGLVVVRATTQLRRLLGARVLEIAGHTPDALMAKMRPYYGGSAEGFRAYGHTTRFYSPALLHAVGVTESARSIPVVLETAAGERETLELETYATSGRHPGGRVWRQLHPEALEGEGEAESDGWLTWLGEADTKLPWSLQEPEQSFRYRNLPQAEVAHVQLRANIGDGKTKIRDFLSFLKRQLKSDRPRHLIWDQRQNSGGDLTRTADFARTLHQYLPEGGTVYVLTSNLTFSAGIYTAFFPEWAEDERTQVVGTQVGDRERFWAESGPAVVLPNSGWRLFYSLQMHDLAEGCHDRELCHIRKERWQIAVGSFEPEVRMPELSTDFLAGRDAAVEWVLGDIGSRDTTAE